MGIRWDMLIGGIALFVLSVYNIVKVFKKIGK